MESLWKDFRRTSEVGQGRWKNAGKISGELRISNPECRLGIDGKMLKRFPTNFEYRPGKDEKMLKRFPTNSEYRPGKMKKCWKDFRRTPEDLSNESFPNIDSKKGIWAFGALRLLGRNGPKTLKPQTPKPLSLNLYLEWINKKFNEL